MPVLKNARHEKFCQERAKGKSQEEAYSLAGYKGSRHNAHDLSTKKYISERVRELQQEAAVKTGITIEYVAEKAKTLLERCMQTEPVRDKEGNPTGEYKFDSGGANSALEKLAKHCGFYKIDNEQKALTNKVHAEDLAILARLGITVIEVEK